MGRRFWRALLCGAALLSLASSGKVGAQGFAAPGASPAPASGAALGQGAKDPPDSHYVVPEEDAAKLSAFIDSVGLFKTPNEGNGTAGITEVRRHMDRSSKAMGAAISRLFSTDATDKQRETAIDVALAHRRNQVLGMSANGRDADLIEAFATVYDEASEPIKEKLKELQLDFKMTKYDDLSPEERQKLASDVTALFKEQSATPATIATLTRFCNAAELAGDDKLAAKTIEQIRPQLGRTEEIRRQWIIGMLRRLRLKGKSYEYVGTVRDTTDPGRIGPEISKAPLKGKVVVVHYFDEWSGDEFDELLAVHNKYRDRGVQFVGAYIGNYGPFPLPVFEKPPIASWPILIWHDAGQTGPDSPISTVYGVTRVPHTMLIDGRGKVIRSSVAIAELDRELEQALQSK